MSSKIESCNIRKVRSAWVMFLNFEGGTTEHYQFRTKKAAFAYWMERHSNEEAKPRLSDLA